MPPRSNCVHINVVARCAICFLFLRKGFHWTLYGVVSSSSSDVSETGLADGREIPTRHTADQLRIVSLTPAKWGDARSLAPARPGQVHTWGLITLNRFEMKMDLVIGNIASVGVVTESTSEQIETSKVSRNSQDNCPPYFVCPTLSSRRCALSIVLCSSMRRGLSSLRHQPTPAKLRC